MPGQWHAQGKLAMTQEPTNLHRQWATRPLLEDLLLQRSSLASNLAGIAAQWTCRIPSTQGPLFMRAALYVKPGTRAHSAAAASDWLWH